MTIPQIMIFEKNLNKICKAEAGEKDTSMNIAANANTEALKGTLQMLKEKTGRSTFTIIELMNPKQTLEKYKKV
jgi:hypothetical protein